MQRESKECILILLIRRAAGFGRTKESDASYSVYYSRTSSPLMYFEHANPRGFIFVIEIYAIYTNTLSSGDKTKLN